MQSDTPTDKASKFEADLQAFFPDIYRLHVLSKMEPKLWTAVYAFMKFIEQRDYGEFQVTFQSGKINHIFRKVTEEVER